jgi:hypothetical protein
VAARLSSKATPAAKAESGARHPPAVVGGKQGAARHVERSQLEKNMVNTNTFCAVCSKPFYASPKHLNIGWGKTCSFECRSIYKLNPRFIENNVQCKNCNKIFHVKPSSQKNKKSKVYCSVECKNLLVRAKKICEKCNKDFIVPKSHESKRKYCSKKCKEESFLSAKPNCICKTCGENFYLKPSEIKKENGSGSFCSVGCMNKNRGKNRSDDGKYISHLEAEMLLIIRAYKLENGLIREYKFHPERKWLIDFSWPDKKIGIEVHGGIWNGKFGGHTSGLGRMRDMEKMNEAKILGWTIIEVASNHIKNGQAIDWLRKLLNKDY